MQYLSRNIDKPPTVRTLEYRPYQPQAQLQPSFGREHNQSPQTYDDSQSEETQSSSSQTEQRALPAQAHVPFSYQGLNKPFEENTDKDADARIHDIFNANLEARVDFPERMHLDELSTTSLSSSLFLNPLMRMSTSLSARSYSEPTFKERKTPDENLSLGFNVSSLRQPTAQQTKYLSTVHKRPGVIYPGKIAPDTTFRGCDMYEGSLLCKKARNYPKLLDLDNILDEELTELGLFFAEDLEYAHNITNRFEEDYYEFNPCDSEERIIYPEAGMTKDSRWMLIVNDKMKYKQGVRIEECRGEDRPCNVINQSLPNHYTSVCRQHYNYRQLVAITEDGRLVKDHFKIPSCCKCMLRNTDY